MAPCDQSVLDIQAKNLDPILEQRQGCVLCSAHVLVAFRLFPGLFSKDFLCVREGVLTFSTVFDISHRKVGAARRFKVGTSHQLEIDG